MNQFRSMISSIFRCSVGKMCVSVWECVCMLWRERGERLQYVLLLLCVCVCVCVLYAFVYLMGLLPLCMCVLIGIDLCPCRDLSNNKISSLSDDSFSNMSQLTTLWVLTQTQTHTPTKWEFNPKRMFPSLTEKLYLPLEIRYDQCPLIETIQSLII